MTSNANDQNQLKASAKETEAHAHSRRNILLGTSALVAAATLTPGALAQAQKAAPAAPGPAPAAPSGRRPNILVIFGDDIGQTNISAYSHRSRRHDVHRLLRRAELHGGAVVVHHRPM